MFTSVSPHLHYLHLFLHTKHQHNITFYHFRRVELLFRGTATLCFCVFASRVPQFLHRYFQKPTIMAFRECWCQNCGSLASGKQYLHKQILSCRLTSSLMFARWHSIHSKVTSIYKTMTWCRYLLISTCIQSSVLKLLNIKKTDSSIISMLIFAPLYLVPSLITTPLNFVCWHKIIAPYNFSAAAPTHCSQTLRWRS